MNPRRVSLILVALNFGLIVALIYIILGMRTTPATGAGAGQTTYVTNTLTQIAVRKINATNLLASFGNRLINWRSLESTNYVLYIENLRNFGCPEETVRDIIITDVAKFYARRRADLRGQLQPYKFWRTTDPAGGTGGTSPELSRKLRELEKEQRQLIRELLGVDLRVEQARYTDDAAETERSYEFLPPEKRDAVRALAEQFDEVEQDLFDRTRGLFLDEDAEALKLIQRQRREQLKALLTPEELEEHDLRHSETANNMRAQLSGFQPTEEEFRRIFKIQQTFDQNFAQGFDERDETAQTVKARAQQAANEALNTEIQNILGPERFAEYQRGQDSDYRSLVQLAERFDMPGDAASKIYNMKQAAEMAKLRIESNPNLTYEQRARFATDIARLTQQSVKDAMGEQPFRSYQNGPGQWLGNLPAVEPGVQQQPSPPPPPTSTILPFDINVLPPEMRFFIQNLPRLPQQQ